MQTDDLRRWRNADPFVPFRLVLDTDKAVGVWHPWSVGFADGGSRCSVHEGRDLHFVELNRIARIEPITP